MMIFSDKPPLEDYLCHYGKGHLDGGKSGRYPWGSGEHPYQRSGDFLKDVEKLQNEGKTETQIASAMGLSTTALRMQLRVAKHEKRAADFAKASKMRAEGKTLQQITNAIGYKNESSVRSLLNENIAANKNRAQAVADILEKEANQKGMVDVGKGVNLEVGCSDGVMKEALFILETRGYNVSKIHIPQVTAKGKQNTTTMVLSKPDIGFKQVVSNLGDIQTVASYKSHDGGLSYKMREYPASVNSNRIAINYGDQGGKTKDGVIEIRPGVEDLNLGNSHYAQVRILVDGTHYLKGMAVYSDDLPEGIDIRYNTNKQSTTPKESVFKKITDDPENPFGASISAKGQSYYIDKDGKERLSAINKVRDEGEWATMSKNLSSQFLSKQPKDLIRRQLNLTYADAESDYDDIMKITNPTVKKLRLLNFADNCESAAVHLQAASLPRQSVQVILPATSIKEDRIFAPNYRDGEQVALIRYPHAGTFEIPILTVSNKNKDAQKTIGTDAKDAVGIHPKVADRLSGADFDGDFVVVIPVNNDVRIKSRNPLKGLESFDPKTQYAVPEGNPNKVKLLGKGRTQTEMGIISNLITDMTLKGATDEELVRAVKHSMVVIDAEKHKLDYKQSEKDQGIADLKKRYQGYIDENGKYVGGASTLLSKRKKTVDVPETRGSGRIDPETGERIYKESGRTYISKRTGEITPAMKKEYLLLNTKDLHSISSGTVAEELYADYGNKMKALANKSRKEAISIKEIPYSPSAKAVYSKEVDELNAALQLAYKNLPKERRAQVIANSKVKFVLDNNPDITKKEEKKIRQIAIEDARAKVGSSSKEVRIRITPKQWEAIQAGAISPSKLAAIIDKADPDIVKELSTPKQRQVVSSQKINKMKAMSNSGYTNQEIADSVGVSVSTVIRYLKE